MHSRGRIHVRIYEIRDLADRAEALLEKQSKISDTLALLASCAPWLELSTPRGAVMVNTPEARAHITAALEQVLDEVEAEIKRMEKELGE